MATRGIWIAGPYVWTFNGRQIGVTENGFRLNMVSHGDPIRGDNLGDSIQDYVYRGGDVYVEGVLNEWDVSLNGPPTPPDKTNANTASIFWPWATLGSTGQVGRLASLVAAPLVGVPAPGTTAAAATVKNLTITYAVLSPGYDISQLFAARHRTIPIRLQALPAPLVDSGSETWFTIT